MTARTSQKLADALRSAGFIALAERAEADEFHDFLSPHATPEMRLASELAHIIADKANSERARTAAHHIRTRLIDGEFDADTEESEAWAKGPDGQDAMRRLSGAHSIGDQPIEPKLNEMMNALAFSIDVAINGSERPKQNGFMLMVFPFEDFEGRANYISNARREDVIVLLKEQLARFEGQPEMKGKA